VMGTEHSTTSHSTMSHSEIGDDVEIAERNETLPIPKAMLLEPGDKVEVFETFESESQTLIKGCCGIVGDINENGHADIDFFVVGQSGKQFSEWVKKDSLCKLKRVKTLEPASAEEPASPTECSRIEREEEEITASLANSPEAVDNPGACTALPLADSPAECNDDDDDDDDPSDDDMLSPSSTPQEPESPAARRQRGLAALQEAQALYKEVIEEALDNCNDDSTSGPHEVAAEKVRRGVIIRLHGLVGTSHLNGMLGLVLYPGKEDRWAVHLDCEEPGCFRNVREQNLEFVCCGGAVQPSARQQTLPTAEAFVASSIQQQSLQTVEGGPTERSPTVPGKRKHASQDAEVALQMSLADQFAELEREQLAYVQKSPLKRRALRKDSKEVPYKHGVDGLVEDILEVPHAQLFRRLMAASTDELAKVVSPEATAYVVLARSYRTRSSGA